MKKVLFETLVCMVSVLSVSCFFLQSCTLTEPEIAGMPESDICSINVKIKDLPEGKVTDTGDEAVVNDAQVFVFREDGLLEAYAKGDTESLSVNCTAGRRSFVVLANAPEVTGISDLDALRSLLSDLGDNKISSLVMSGEASSDIDQTRETVFVSVSRLVARVSLSGISVDFETPVYEGAEVTLTEIYLSNVAGTCPYLSEIQPEKWYNMSGISGDCADLLSSGPISVPVPDGGTYDTVNYFYCYPNTVDVDSSQLPWTPRKTRLVVKAEISGRTYYYPITFEKLLPNHSYDIKSLTITRLGSDDPDTPVRKGTVSLSLLVTDWRTGSSTSVVI